MATLFDILLFIFISSCALRGLYRGPRYELRRSFAIITSIILAYYFSTPLFYTLQIYISNEGIAFALANVGVFYLSFKIITIIVNEVLFKAAPQQQSTNESKDKEHSLSLIYFIFGRLAAPILGTVNGYMLAMLAFLCTHMMGINDMVPSIKNTASGALLGYGMGNLTRALPNNPQDTETNKESKDHENDKAKSTKSGQLASRHKAAREEDVKLETVIRKMRDLLSDEQRQNLDKIIVKLSPAKVLSLYQAYQHSPQDFYQNVLKHSKIEIRPQRQQDKTIDQHNKPEVTDHDQPSDSKQQISDRTLDTLIDKVASEDDRAVADIKNEEQQSLNNMQNDQAKEKR